MRRDLLLVALRGVRSSYGTTAFRLVWSDSTQIAPSVACSDPCPYAVRTTVWLSQSSDALHAASGIGSTWELEGVIPGTSAAYHVRGFARGGARVRCLYE